MMMLLDQYKKAYPDPDHATPGWDAIDNSLKAIYGDQKPLHWGTVLPMMLGGEDPLDGISAYRCEDGGIPHLHFCSYGFTSLYYDEDAVGCDFSRFGFELTFRLKIEDETPQNPVWVCRLIQNLAKYVSRTGNWFEDNHWIPTNGPIRLQSDTTLVGIAFSSDPRMPRIDTPHGNVDFLQMFGITQKEIDGLGKDRELTKRLLDKHRIENPLLITDLKRTDS